jgi:hypothetical protein
MDIHKKEVITHSFNIELDIHEAGTLARLLSEYVNKATYTTPRTSLADRIRVKLSSEGA